MMERRERIGAGQLCCVAFMSRPIVMLTLNSAVLGGEAVLDNTLSAALVLILGLLSAVPVFLLFRRYPTLNIIDTGYSVLGRAGLFVPALYILYFILMGCYYVSFFEAFIGNVMDPKTPVWLIALGVIAISCYGAKRGIEAVARTSGFVIVAVVLGVLVILCTLTTEVRPENYRPLLYGGASQTWQGALIFLARGTVLPVLAFLLPVAKGKVKTGFVLWSIVAAAVFGILIFVLVGALGSFLNTQLFPVYTASALSRIGPVQRMDALFLAIWMAGLVMELSAAFYILSLCGKRICPKKGGNFVLFGAAGFIFAGAVIAAYSIPVQRVLFGRDLLLYAAAVAALGIPLLLLAADFIRRRKNTHFGKKAAVGMLALFLLFLTGCEGQVTLNRRMFVQGMGVDYQDGRYQVSVHAGVMEEENSKTVLYEGTGETVLDALDAVVQYSGKTPMYSHNMFVLLGKGCGENGIQNVMDFFVRYYETRASVYVFYCEEDAQTLFSLQDEEGNYPLAEETEILTDAEKVAGRTINANVVDVVNGLHTQGRSAFLPVMEEDDKKLRMNGTAYFKDGVFSGILDSDETRGMLLLMNRFQYGAVAVSSDTAGQVTLSLRDASCKIETQLQDGTPHFKIVLRCEADISEITEGLGKPLDSRYYGEFEKALNDCLTKQITAAIETAAVEGQCDIFGLSGFLLRQQPEFWREHAEEWPLFLQNLSYTVCTLSNVDRMEEEITPLFR